LLLVFGVDKFARCTGEIEAKYNKNPAMLAGFLLC